MVEDCYDSTKKRLRLKAQTEEFQKILDIVVKFLVSSGFEQLRCTAPRGGLERMLQNDVDNMRGA